MIILYNERAKGLIFIRWFLIQAQKPTKKLCPYRLRILATGFIIITIIIIIIIIVIFIILAAIGHGTDDDDTPTHILLL